MTGVEEAYLKRKRASAAAVVSKEDELDEFKAIFDNGSTKVKPQRVTDEDLEFFNSNSGFHSSADLENIQLETKKLKKIDKGKFDKDQMTDSEDEDEDSQDSQDEKEEEDPDYSDEGDLEEDGEELDEEEVENKFIENREHRNWTDFELVRNRLPIKNQDGTVKKITEIQLTPQVRKEQLPFEKFEQSKILTRKEKRELEQTQRKQEAMEKKRMEYEKREEKKNKQKQKKIDEDLMEEEDQDLGDDVIDRDQEQDDVLGGDGSQDDKPMSEADLFLKHQMEVETAKTNLSKLASRILEDPERNIMFIKDIFAICILSQDIIVKKLGVLSLGAVFKDIIPGYKIHVDKGNSTLERVDGKVQKVKYSKEIQQAKQYEAKLMKFYQTYLVFIENTIDICLNQQQAHSAAVKSATIFSSFVRKGEFSIREYGGLLLQVIKCAATLLVSHPHFNFRTNLVTIVTRFSVYRDNEVSTLCISHIRDLFKQDTTGGETSLEVIRNISNVAKVTNYMFDPRIIRTFMVLRFNDLVEKVNPYGTSSEEYASMLDKKKKLSNKERKLLSHNDRKEFRKEKKLEQEMEEASAVYSSKEQKYIQTEMLKSVFLTYFRIIKRAPHSLAMTSVLEGLARFSHHISVDFLGDMLQALSTLMENQVTTLPNALNASITAFKTVKLHGHTLNVDLKDYFSKVYSMLGQLALPSQQHVCVLALNALQLMLGERKQTAVERVAAFIKRVAIISLSTPPNASLAIISFIKHLFVIYPQVQRIIENDGTYTGGEYNFDIEDPDHCNPFATSLWELSFFYKHWHPAIDPVAKRTLAFNERASELVGREKTPPEIFELYDTSKGGFNPPIKIPADHPLKLRAKKLEEEKLKAKGKKLEMLEKQKVFVIPSSQYPKSSFLTDITKQVQEFDESSVSFASYFTELKDYEQELKLSRQLKRLEKVKIIATQQFKLKQQSKESKPQPQQPQQPSKTPTTTKATTKTTKKQSIKK
ncbi:hypothetical protein DFA_08783 [Cavenderia fasciculata]|uniref:Nucleolar complex protein 3 homolog n=1 Tax=Cavenderia fasciculata TaxID=261658 RepID=F4Q481_CACFS|nr:uncharacterized protein DFA_08783 [Cavenderia fasciculata]EGG17783.1 hypothetical protein DFA_08783 [Cavenderia fasciculata]|eukprot:XP_004356267.1 hypothetical protein DFA_08783 [Cavenderia fasciculata]